MLVWREGHLRCFVGTEVVFSDAGSATILLNLVLSSTTGVLTSIGWSAMKWPCTGNRLETERDRENADTSALLHVYSLPCSPGATVNFVISILDSTNVL